MKETITLTEAKELHELCKEKDIETPFSRFFWGEHPEGNNKTSYHLLNVSDATYRDDESIPDKDDYRVAEDYYAYATNELLEWITSVQVGTLLTLSARNTKIFQARFGKTLGEIGDTPQSALVKLLIELIKKELIK